MDAEPYGRTLCPIEGQRQTHEGGSTHMNRSLRDSARAAENAVRRSALRGGPGAGSRWLRPALIARGVALAGILSAAVAIFATPAMALTASHNVAMIPSNQPSPPQGYLNQDGILPVSTTVAGNPNESFGKFSFTNVAVSQITAAELAKFDTVVLNEVRVTSLTTAEETVLSQFVANGGKLLIDDADATHNNDYSWVVPGTGTTQVGAGCNNCGLTSGTSMILNNSGLISANPSDPSYVNIADMQHYTDAIGDSNLLTSSALGRGWFAVVQGTDAKGEAGAQLAYATNANGLVVYNGFDTDMVMPTSTSSWRCVMDPQTHYDCPAKAAHEQVDWVAQMWYNELNESWGPSAAGGLPMSTLVSSIGTSVAPGAAGLPSNTKCVAKKSILLRLRRLVSHHNGKHIVEIDVFLNGRHRIREHGHWHNVTLRRLPKHGTYVVKIVATTTRHYHLVSRGRYHAC
jgi:hypothetical protein